MSPLSGLSTPERIRARDMAVQGAALCLHNAAHTHYTQGPQRWEGIDKNLKAWRGEFPVYSDCSSFVTWCLWQGLDHFHIGDIVNNENWKAGFTGTMLDNGVRVAAGSMQRGDAVIYGTGAPGHHTAIHVGGGIVISHGSENGPNKLPYDQMGQPILQIRRYI